jgi:hypothetical protein
LRGGRASRRLRHPALALTLLAAAGPTFAADGVIEINQARALAGGITAGDAPGFPITLSQSGSYRLSGNLQVASPSIDAIQVTANDVTIDLGGFSIIGPATCSGVGSTLLCGPTGAGEGIDVSGAADGTTVRNGTIRGMGGAAMVLGLDGRAENVRATRNASGGIDVFEGSVVACTVSRNAGPAGIMSGGLIRDNVVSQNLGDGIQSNGAVVGNVVRGNGGVGASLAPIALFSGNQFFANTGGSVSGGKATGGNACDDGRCTRTGERRFYLTQSKVDGAHALTACTQGFHMASLWEMQDPTQLRYDGVLGPSGGDTGAGPPTDLFLLITEGWVRTGTGSNTGAEHPGLEHCGFWASTGQFPYFVGTVAFLPNRWDDPAAAANPTHPWQTGLRSCSSTVRVWCIED